MQVQNTGSPGDMLELHVEKIAVKFAEIAGKGIVDGQVVNQAEFSAMIVDKDS